MKKRIEENKECSIVKSLRSLLLEDLIHQRDHYDCVEDAIKEAYRIGQYTEAEVLERVEEILERARNI